MGNAAAALPHFSCCRLCLTGRGSTALLFVRWSRGARTADWNLIQTAVRLCFTAPSFSVR
jgi:hypothetical protein